MFTRFIRTGDPGVFHAARAAYRHYLDVDLDYDTGLPRFHGYGDRGEMHDAPATGFEWGHIAMEGLVDAHWFTGDRRAPEGAKRMAGSIISAFRAGPPFFAQRVRSTHREIAWPVLGLQRLFEATGERVRLDAAGEALEFLSPSSRPRADGTRGRSAGPSHFCSVPSRGTGA